MAELKRAGGALESDAEISAPKRSKSSSSTTPTPLPDPPSWPSRRKTKPCPHPSCPKSFDRDAKLAEHLNSHTGARPFTCSSPGCCKSFAQKRHLNRHVQSAHSAVRNFLCTEVGCGKAFRENSRLRRHRETHARADLYRCVGYEPCGESFRKHATLQRHVDAVHLGKKPFPCTGVDEISGEKCGKGFQRSCCLRVHVRRFHSGLHFWCEICTESQQQQQQQQQPESQAQPGSDADSDADADDGPLPIEPMGPPPPPQAAEHNHKPPPLGFPTFQSYTLHLQTAHPPTCTLCTLSFSTLKALASHLKTSHLRTSHSEPPPADPHPPSPALQSIPCPSPFCARSYATRKTLNQHFARSHLQIRYTCGTTALGEPSSRSAAAQQLAAFDSATDGCGRGFSTMRSLEDHVLSAHLGLPPRRGSRASSSVGGATPGVSRWVSGATTPSSATGSSGPKTPSASEMLFDDATLVASARALAVAQGKSVFCEFRDGGTGARCEFAAKVPYHLALHLRMGHALSEDRVEAWMVDWEIERRCGGGKGVEDGDGREGGFAGFLEGWEGEEE